MEFATFPANSTQNKSLFRTVGSAHTWQMVIGVWMCWAGNVCALQSPWIIWQRQWGVTGEQYSPFPFWNTLNFPEPPLELEMRTHKPCPVSKSLSGSTCELNILHVWTVRLALILTQVHLAEGQILASNTQNYVLAGSKLHHPRHSMAGTSLGAAPKGRLGFRCKVRLMEERWPRSCFSTSRSASWKYSF